MNNNHLSDDIIQSYLLKEISDEQVARHISECLDCKAKLMSYQSLFKQISEIESESFSFDVTAIVMPKIAEADHKKATNGRYGYIAIVSIIIISVFALSYPFIQPVFQLFRHWTGMATLMMLVSALGIFIFLVMDAIRQYKQKEMMIAE